MVTKKVKKITGVIIGPSGIGRVHLRELINLVFKKHCAYRKNLKKIEY